jgi:hypothetical protein
VRRADEQGFIWGCFSVLTVAFVYLFVPEMKGFSLEQLDYLYDRGTPTRAFKGYHFTDDVLASTDSREVETRVLRARARQPDWGYADTQGLEAMPGGAPGQVERGHGAMESPRSPASSPGVESKGPVVWSQGERLGRT